MSSAGIARCQGARWLNVPMYRRPDILALAAGLRRKTQPPSSSCMQVYRGTCGCEPAAIKVCRGPAGSSWVGAGQLPCPGLCQGAGSSLCEPGNVSAGNVPHSAHSHVYRFSHTPPSLQVIKDPAGAGVSEMDRQQLLREVAILKSCRWAGG